MTQKLVLILTLLFFAFPLVECVKKDTGKITSFYSFPNPFNSTDAATGQLKFRIKVAGGITYKYKIEVFSETGSPVYIAQNSATGDLDLAWNGTDNRGNVVNNGVYTTLLTLEETSGGNVIGTYQAFCYTVKN